MGLNDLVDRYKQNVKQIYQNIESGKLQEDLKKMAQDYSDNEKKRKEEYQETMRQEIPDPEDASFVYSATFNESSKSGRVFVYEDRLVVIYKDTLQTKEYDYSGISDVRKFMGSMCITGSNSKDQTFLYIDREKQDSILSYVQEKVGISTGNSNANTNNEIMRRCKVCGKVWCYTAQELKSAKMQGLANAMADFGAAAGAMSGRYGTVMAANSSYRQTVNYEKCPNCGSSNTEITETIDADQRTDVGEGNSSDTGSKVDVPEELRKYKSLLDDGIITDEEFAAKKKQLLGI